MEYAIISDIHGNLEALETVFEYLKSRNISRIVCLGDVVGYGPNPNECIELIQKNSCVCVLGNHDSAIVGKLDLSYFNHYARQAVLWTQQVTGEANKDYLKSLKLVETKENSCFVHSAPVNPELWNYIFSEADARSQLEQVEHNIVFIGHSHVPGGFPYCGDRFYQEGTLWRLEGENRYIVNVGSVGQPRDGDPRACFVIYDETAYTLEYIRLVYPVEKTIQQIFKHKLPVVFALRLQYGQ